MRRLSKDLNRQWLDAIACLSKEKQTVESGSKSRDPARLTIHRLFVFFEFPLPEQVPEGLKQAI
jgi:hypothetical protein